MPVTSHVLSGIEPGSIFGNGISGSNQWKHCDGIYLISRVKENMVLQSFASNRFDADNELNIGVISDELVGPWSVGVTLLRIAYRDPATQEYDEFITSEMPPAPGLIAQLYRMRWAVEKVYDEVTNRLHEQKAWATSAIAKTMQAQCEIREMTASIFVLARELEPRSLCQPRPAL